MTRCPRCIARSVDPPGVLLVTSAGSSCLTCGFDPPGFTDEERVMLEREALASTIRGRGEGIRRRAPMSHGVRL